MNSKGILSKIVLAVLVTALTMAILYLTGPFISHTLCAVSVFLDLDNGLIYILAGILVYILFLWFFLWFMGRSAIRKYTSIKI